MNGMGETTTGSMIEQLEEQFPPQGGAKLETAEGKARAAIASARENGRELLHRLKSGVQERPYVGMGICLGAGVVLGALFGSRAMRIAAIGAVGYLVSRIPLNDMADSVRQGLDGSSGTQGKPRKSHGKQT